MLLRVRLLGPEFLTQRDHGLDSVDEEVEFCFENTLLHVTHGVRWDDVGTATYYLGPTHIDLSVAYLQAIEELDGIGNTSLVCELTKGETPTSHQVFVVLYQMKRLQPPVVEKKVLDLLLCELFREPTNKHLQRSLLNLGGYNTQGNSVNLGY